MIRDYTGKSVFCKWEGWSCCVQKANCARFSEMAVIIPTMLLRKMTLLFPPRVRAYLPSFWIGVGLGTYSNEKNVAEVIETALRRQSLKMRW